MHLAAPLLCSQQIQVLETVLQACLSAHPKLQFFRFILRLHPFKLCAPDYSLGVEFKDLRNHQRHLNQFFIHNLRVLADEPVQEFLVFHQEFQAGFESGEVGRGLRQVAVQQFNQRLLLRIIFPLSHFSCDHNLGVPRNFLISAPENQP